jgi:serine/threonine-protein kinase
MRPRGRGGGLRLFLGLLTVAAMLALMTCVVNWVVMPLVARRGAESVVPSVTGLPLPEAEQLLRRAGLARGTVRNVPSPTLAAGQVVAQYPRAGRRTKRGRQVDLDVSAGTARIRVPAVEGLPTAGAVLALAQNGLVVTRIESLRTPRIPPDQVIAVRPAVGSEVSPGTEVVISISTRVGMFPMPNLAGVSTETAQGIIASQGLVAGEVRTAVSSEPVGRVLFQYPEEGMPVVEGDTVTLIVAGRADGAKQ